MGRGTGIVLAGCGVTYGMARMPLSATLSRLRRALTTGVAASTLACGDPPPSGPFTTPPLPQTPGSPVIPLQPPVMLATVDSLPIPALPAGVACCREVWTSGVAVYLLATGPASAVVLRRTGTLRDGAWQQVVIGQPVASIRPVPDGGESAAQGQVYWVAPTQYGVATIGGTPAVTALPNPAAPSGLLQLIPDAAAGGRAWAVGKDGRILRQRTGGVGALAVFDTVRGARSASPVRGTRAAATDASGRLVLGGVHDEDALTVSAFTDNGIVQTWSLADLGGTPATLVDVGAGRTWIGSPTAVVAQAGAAGPYVAVRVQGTVATPGVPHLCVQGAWLLHTDGTKTSTGATGRVSWLQSAGAPTSEQVARMERMRERLAGGIHCWQGGGGTAVFTVGDGHLYQFTPPA